MNSSACISNDGIYRYSLLREWDEKRMRCVFIMLNPSTADAVKDDATITRCLRRAELYGFGSLGVFNIYALRATNPLELYDSTDPIGPENDAAILGGLKHPRISLVVCGWGKLGLMNGRQRQVLQLIQESGHVPYALKINKDGSPKHPLYVGYETHPIKWELTI